MSEWVKAVRERVGTAIADPLRETEIVEELALHVEQKFQDLIDSGIDDASARDAALAELERVDDLLRQLRLARTGPATAPLPPSTDGWIGQRAAQLLSFDLKTVLRSLLGHPRFTLAAVLTLALGIGAGTAIFSIVYGVLFRPLPYQAPEQLAMIRADIEGMERVAALSAPELDDLRQNSGAFESFAGIWGSGIALTDGEYAEQIQHAWVTASLFPMLGVDPILGRHFTLEDEDSQAEKVILLSEELWRRRYSADPEIVGKPVELNDQTYSVIGVVPEGFWLPRGATVLSLERYDAYIPQTYWINRQQRWLRVLARLAPGITFEQAEEELARIAEGLNSAHSEYANSRLKLHAEPLHNDLIREVRPAMLALLAAVGFVLLVACINVAGLMLARFRKRRQEVAIRLTLGASRATIVRQFLAETLMLTVLGGIGGVALAAGGLQLLLTTVPQNLPRLHEVRLDGPVLMATLVTSLVCGLLVGLLSAWQASRIGPAGALADNGRATDDGQRTRLRSALIVGEVAISLVLLIGAGLMIQTFLNLRLVDPGFTPRKILTFRVSIDFQNHKDGPSRWNYFRQFQEELNTLPGVAASAGVSIVPLAGGLRTGTYAYDPASEADWGKLPADYRTVTPGYFDVLQTPLVAGRDFSTADATAQRKVVMVDETLANQAWPGENPVGKRLKLLLNPSGNEQVEEWAEVIGVVRHVRLNQLQSDGIPQIYRPFWLDNPLDLSFVARTERDPALLTAPIRELVRKIGSRRPVHRFEVLDQFVDEAMAATRFTLTLMSIFAAIAILLSALGLYSLISFSVTRRTREFGIRMALGAEPGKILKLVLFKGLALATAGILLGWVAAALLTDYLSTLLYQVRATDVQTYLLLALLILAVSTLASVLPARRATRVDPVIALRTE